MDANGRPKVSEPILQQRPTASTGQQEAQKCDPAPKARDHGGVYNYVKMLALNTWIGETIALVFSAACLVAIAGIMAAYDGSSAPQFPYGLALNAIASIFAAASKSALICAVAAAISQLKWLRFVTKSRSLEEMNSIDEASREPLGSLIILPRFYQMPLVSIGALITIVAIAFDPFVQQVFKYPVRPTVHPKNVATTQNAAVFHAPPSSTKFQDTVLAGLWSPPGQLERNPVCPSGNCQWPIFESVGVCSECTDALDEARVAGDRCVLHNNFNEPLSEPFECGLTFDDGDKLILAKVGRLNGTSHGGYTNQFSVNNNAIWTLHNPGSLQDISTGDVSSKANRTVLGHENPYLALGYVEAALTNSEKHSYNSYHVEVSAAQKCVISPCLRKYKISVVNGAPNITILSTNWGVVKYQVLHPSHPKFPGNMFPVACWQPGTEHVEDGPNPPINYTTAPVTNTSQHVFCMASSYATSIMDNIQFSHYAKNLWGGGSGYLQTPGKQITEFPVLMKILRYNLTYVLEGVTASLSKLALDESDVVVTGNVTTSEPYVHVQWPWLTLPIVLELMGILLFAVAVMVNSRHDIPLWKSSLLPLLYHGLEEELLDRNAAPRDINGMENVARNTSVQLRPDGQDGILFLRKTGEMKNYIRRQEKPPSKSTGEPENRDSLKRRNG